MEKFETLQFKEENRESEGRKYSALDNDGKKDKILSEFSESEKTEIIEKQKVLSSLAYFIGKDFEIPVELNIPGQGWHWNFKENKIRIDPKDLLEKPMDYLRFVISHEGGHRRISRTEFIPLEEWAQPGFSFMMNAIEDPRDNNFVAENYPKFKEQMAVAYEHDIDIENKSKEKAQKKLGYQPRFMKAGFEYIKQWFRERKDEEFEISEDLPEEVKDVVQKTLTSAQDSWWRYPSRQEADDRENGEKNIMDYARVSYEINRDEVWPEFQKLVEIDMEDQKMQEFMKDVDQQKADGAGEQGLPQEMKDKLTPEEQKELEDAIDKAIEKAKQEQKQKTDSDGSPSDKDSEEDKSDEIKGVFGKEGVPIDIDSLSDKLKQKIKEYIDSLPEEKRKEFEEKAKKSLGEFGDEIADDIGGKLSDNPKKREKRGVGDKVAEGAAKTNVDKKHIWEETEKEILEEQKIIRKKIEEVFDGKNEGTYQKSLEEVSTLIDYLTGDLRDVFIKRKLNKNEEGYRHGRKWNIKKRIKEKVAGIPLLKTEAREQPESPSDEQDYAITLMIDLSGSMQGEKIEEAFKSAVVLAETLNNLDIKFELVGFQDILLEFKSFEEDLTDEMREKLGGLVLEVSNNNPGGHNNARDNNDGECLLLASKHLADMQSDNKFLIVLSDGEPSMGSGRKSGSVLDRELHDAVSEIAKNTDQKLIGVGLLSGAVSEYYENNIPNVTAEEMTETLGELLRGIIENY